jgi:hypothetical protein
MISPAHPGRPDDRGSYKAHRGEVHLVFGDGRFYVIARCAKRDGPHLVGLLQAARDLADPAEQAARLEWIRQWAGPTFRLRLPAEGRRLHG